MKKLISLLLALVMVLSLSTVAFATENPVNQTLKKNYKLANEGTTAPAETFNFTIEASGVTDAAEGVTVSHMPVPTLGSAAFTDGTTATSGDGTDVAIPVTMPVYTSVGVYTYKITETGTKNTAGVAYSNDEIKMKVTVVNGADGGFEVESVSYTGNAGSKGESFKNVYSAGSLAVKKEVTGNLGDKTKEFAVNVTFTAPTDKTVKSDITYVDGTETKHVTFAEGATTATAEITLKHNETMTFTNIPYGVTYTVAEDSYSADGYDAATYVYSNKGDSKIMNSASESVVITNNKDGNVDTGVVLDTLPYVMILAVAAVCGMALLLKKRHMAD